MQCNNSLTDIEKKTSIFQTHVNLIANSKNLTDEKLKEKIEIELERLADLADDGIPTEPKTGRTLFHVVLLERKYLDKQIKCSLIEHLVHYLGYSPFYEVIFKNSEMMKEILNKEFSDLLLHIYSQYLIKDIEYSLEERIWQSILSSPKHGLEVLKELQNYRKNHDKMMQFIEYWLNSIKSKADIPELYAKIKKIADVPLQAYLPYIAKLARCRILTIEYLIQTKCLTEENLSSEKKKMIQEFLHAGDHTLIALHPSAFSVYETIHTDHVSHGLHEYQNKIARLENEINEELAMDQGHHKSFRFRM